MAEAYTEGSITTLTFREHVRARVSMYLNSPDQVGMEVGAREIIDNIIDEWLNGHGSLVYVRVFIDGTMTIADNARGIPTGPYPSDPSISTLEAIVTRDRTGGKFGGYGISGGLNGIGLKAVAATSTGMTVVVMREGKRTTLTLEKGVVVGGVTSVKLPKKDAALTGTSITFRFDPEVFTDTPANGPRQEVLRTMLVERSFLCSGLQLEFQWHDQPMEVFKTDGGLAALVAKQLGDDAPPSITRVIPLLRGTEGDIPVEVALMWTSKFDRPVVNGYTNIVRQPDGGTHVQGLRMALPGVLRKYIKEKSILGVRDKDLVIEPSDCFEGVSAVVSIRHTAPAFRGQAKTSLSNTDAQGAVQRVVNTELASWLEANPRDAKLICQRVIIAAKGRVAAAKSRDATRSLKKESSAMLMQASGKLAECGSRDPEATELFIVEGDSASGSAKQGRDRRTQAILSLRGKPINSWDSEMTSVLANAEMRDLTAAIGVGLFTQSTSAAAASEAMAKRRYSRVIILADGDSDGNHIGALLLGHFFRHCRPLIEGGYVYMGMPPLYRVAERGKKYTYLQDDAALQEFFKARASVITSKAPVHVKWVAPIAPQLRRELLACAAKYGADLREVSFGLKALLTFDDTSDQPLMSFAQRYSDVRAETCEAVTIEATNSGVAVVRGLDQKRFFVTVVSVGFYNACADAYAVLAEHSSHELASALIMDGGKLASITYDNAVDVVQQIAARAEHGAEVTRMKGLGSMDPEELGETALNPTTRRIQQITVNDFDATGRFVEAMLGKDGVQARKDFVASGILDVSHIDI